MRSERGAVDVWLALTMAILLLVPLSYATSQVVQAARLRAVLQQGAKMVAQAETAAGGYTTNGQKALAGYLAESGLNPDRVYLSTTPGQQGYGQDNMDVVLGYDYDVVLPGTPWTIWHSYVQSGNPAIQSDYVPGAIDASIVSPGGFTGTQINGGGGNTPVTVVDSLTISLNQASSQAGQSVTISGRDLEGSNPPPAGTIVSVSGAGINTSATTDANGHYTASFTVKTAGTYTVSASCGIASASAQLSVTPAAAGQIQLTAPQSVTVGNSLQIDGQVTDVFGNPIADGTSIIVSSNDQNDIPGSQLSTTNGAFAFKANQITLSPLNSPLTVSFSSGDVSATADITVLPGPPEKIVLNDSPVLITAGQSVTFSGQVTSVAGTPVTQGTDVGIGDVNDTQDAFPVTVQTDQNGNYVTSPVVTTLAGQQTVDAGVTVNGQTVSAQETVNVSPGEGQRP